MFPSKEYHTKKNPEPCLDKICINRDESTISTNRDSICNKYSLKCNRTISHYKNFEKYNNYEDKRDFKCFYNNNKDDYFRNNNNYELVYKTQSYNKDNEKNFLYRNNSSNYYSFNNNHLYNEKNNSIKNKTINILNLNKNESSDLEEKSNSKNMNIQKNNFDLYMKMNKSNSNRYKKNKKLIVKNSFKINNISERNNCKYLRNNKNNFDLGKKTLESIKQRYINNTISTQRIINEVKNCLNDYDMNTILELNRKCLKYSDLIKPDNLYRYREENNKNLKKYKPKSKPNNKNTTKRPLTYNTKLEKKKSNKFNAKNGNNLNKNKKYLSAENIKRKQIKESRKKVTNNMVSTVLKNDYINNNFQKNLDYYNYLLKENEKKKNLLFDELDSKSKENDYFKYNHLNQHTYGCNLSKGYNSHNFDKNLHLKYIYHPESEMNLNVYTPIPKEEIKSNYHINLFNYRRKKFF